MPTIVPELDKPFPKLSRERIALIASWLPERPMGIGPHAEERVVWERLAQSPVAQEFIAEAERYQTEPRPELTEELYMEFLRNGNRTHYQEAKAKRLRRMKVIALAELLEFQGRFLPALKDELVALCDERSWVIPAHDPKLLNYNGTAPYAELSCTHICLDVAIIDWWFGDLLGAELRQRLRDEVQRRAFNAYLKVIRTGVVTDYQWWTIYNSNWNPVCNNGMAGTALMFMPSREERAEVLAAAEQSMAFYATGFTPDGYCSEGVSYWNYSFGNFLNLAETALLATGGRLNFLENPLFQRVAAYGRDIQIEPGSSPAFADCGTRARLSESITSIIQRFYPASVFEPVPPLDRPILDFQTMILRVMGDKPLAPDVKAVVLPARSYFSDAGIYVGRSDVRFGVACKMGNNDELHNHNDIGSFCIALKGHQYFLDPGNEIYTYRTFSEHRYEGQMLNSFGHMVPVVAGSLQPEGREVYGTFLHTEFSEEQDTLVGDMTTAYPEVDALVSLKRTFVFDRKARSLTVRDEVEFSSPQSFETALVSYDKLEFPSTDRIVASDENGSVTAQVTADGGELRISVGEIDNPGAVNPKRVALAFAEPVLKAAITVVFHG
ncbi:MAG: heparinase II/III family protein [Victivallales bacterium]|nr:heparinase II/III family protein [Victivallales bacterium]